VLEGEGVDVGVAVGVADGSVLKGVAVGSVPVGNGVTVGTGLLVGVNVGVAPLPQPELLQSWKVKKSPVPSAT